MGAFGWTVVGSVAGVVAAAAVIVFGLIPLARRSPESPDNAPPSAVRLPQGPENLAGRDKLLAELDARFAAAAQAGTRPGVVALYGLGGAGKTSVAVEYAHRQLAKCGVVWHFRAEDPTVLADGFRDLAAELGAGDGREAGNPAARVHAALARRSDWLLVFDNVPDPAQINEWLPPAGGGRVLITSQYPWPGGQGLEVPMLDRAAAAGFLMTRTGAAGTEETAAGELAGELGGLPLALEQAAAYMRTSGRSIGEYLRLFRARRGELLAIGDPAGYDGRVATTWALAFDNLGPGGPAAGLLRLAAYCAAEDIPLPRLLGLGSELAQAFAAEVASLLVPLMDDPLAQDKAVAGLRRYSLISAPHNGLVSVHRLVQAITVAQLPPDVAADWRQATAAVIEAALPEDPEKPEAWPTFAALLPHARAALTLASYGMDKIVTYLRASGNYRVALDLQRQIVEACQAGPDEEPSRTLDARARLATLTGQTGDPAAARAQFGELLPLMTRTLSGDDRATLSARASLAYWTGETGEKASARDQYTALLPVMTRVLGDTDRATLAVLNNLARLTGDTGDPAAARAQFGKLLPLMTRILGEDDRATLTTRASLAYWTGEAGDPAAARDQYAALLPIRQRILSPEHPDTLITRASLARWTGEAGDPAAARDQYAALLPIQQRILSPEHPDTLITRASLARWTGEAGDPAAARDQYAALLPIRQRILGDEHPDTLTTGTDLAYWKRQAENSGSRGRAKIFKLGPAD